MRTLALYQGAISQEDYALAYLRDRYIRSEIEIDEFERNVGLVLSGEWTPPRGVMPPPDTGAKTIR